jgi:photosystem II stability/assembly factor-like uncharacterized protein
MSSDGTHLIAAVNGGRIYISTNSGSSWAETQPAGDNDEGWSSVAINSDGLHLIVADNNWYSDDGSVYVGSYNGSTLSWANADPEADESDHSWQALAISSDGTYMIAVNGDDPGLYISSDSGSSWAKTQPVGINSSNWQSVAMSSDGTHIIAAGSYIYIYIN